MSDVSIDRYNLAEQIVRAQLQRDALDEQIAQLKSYFNEGQSLELTQEGRPNIIVKVSPNRRIDDGLAREVLDEETYQTVSKQVIDTAKARAFLSPEVVDSITKNYTNKVEVKLA